MLFPKRYGDLTTELLGYLGGPDSNEVTELFEQRRQRRLAGAQARLQTMTLDEQVAELTAHPRRGRLPGRRRAARRRRLAHHRAQLRHPVGGHGLSPGLFQRDRLHP